MPGARLWRLIIFITVTMAASYYCVVIGWVLQEAIAFVVAAFSKQSVVPFATLTDGSSRTLAFAEVKAWNPYLRDGGNPGEAPAPHSEAENPGPSSGRSDRRTQQREPVSGLHR